MLHGLLRSLEILQNYNMDKQNQKVQVNVGQFHFMVQGELMDSLMKNSSKKMPSSLVEKGA